MKTREEPINKPPIGLRPKDVAAAVNRDRRVKEIVQAMHRYVEANEDIPWAWVSELRTLVPVPATGSAKS